MNRFNKFFALLVVLVLLLGVCTFKSLRLAKGQHDRFQIILLNASTLPLPGNVDSYLQDINSIIQSYNSGDGISDMALLGQLYDALDSYYGAHIYVERYLSAAGISLRNGKTDDHYAIASDDMRIAIICLRKQLRTYMQEDALTEAAVFMKALETYFEELDALLYETGCFESDTVEEFAERYAEFILSGNKVFSRLADYYAV